MIKVFIKSRTIKEADKWKPINGFRRTYFVENADVVLVLNSWGYLASDKEAKNGVRGVRSAKYKKFFRTINIPIVFSEKTLRLFHRITKIPGYKDIELRRDPGGLCARVYNRKLRINPFYVEQTTIRFKEKGRMEKWAKWI